MPKSKNYNLGSTALIIRDEASRPLTTGCTTESGRTASAEEVCRLRVELSLADRQVRSGHYIKHEDMKAWLLSWGTDRELPVPKCACGSSEF